MAINVDISKITGINQVGNSYQRKSAVPLDYYSFFNTKAAAETYAASNPVAYIGQYVAYTHEGKVFACVIADEAGTLKEIGSKPVGDNASIEVAENGTVSIFGFDDLTNDKVRYLPVTKLVGEGEDAHLEIEWVAESEIAPELVAGLGIEVDGTEISAALASETKLADSATVPETGYATVAVRADSEGHLAVVLPTDEKVTTLIGDDTGKSVRAIVLEEVGSAGHLKREIVEELPAVENADPDTIYMVPAVFEAADTVDFTVSYLEPTPDGSWEEDMEWSGDYYAYFAPTADMNYQITAIETIDTFNFSSEILLTDSIAGTIVGRVPAEHKTYIDPVSSTTRDRIQFVIPASYAEYPTLYAYFSGTNSVDYCVLQELHVKTDVDSYKEFIFIDGHFVQIGDTSVNLEGYATEAYVNNEVKKVSDNLANNYMTAGEIATTLTNYVTDGEFAEHAQYAEDTYAKAANVYTKEWIDDEIIGTPGIPAEKDAEGKETKPAVPGTGIFTHVYSKTEVTDLIADITGGESAADVKAELKEYKSTNDAAVKIITDEVWGKDVTDFTKASRIDNLETNVGTNTTDISNLKGIVNGPNGNDGLANKVAVLEAEVYADKTAAESRIDGLATSLGVLSTTVGGHTTTLTTLDKVTIPELDGRVGANETAVQNILKSIGTVPTGKTVMGLIGSVPEGETVIGLIDAVDEKVGKIDLTPYALVTSVEKIYKKDAEDKESGLLVDEITRATGAENALGERIDGVEDIAEANAAAIATLIGEVAEDDAKSVRAIATEVAAGIAAGHLKREIVNELPSAEDADPDTIYMVSQKLAPTGRHYGAVDGPDGRDLSGFGESETIDAVSFTGLKAGRGYKLQNYTAGDGVTAIYICSSLIDFSNENYSGTVISSIGASGVDNGYVIQLPANAVGVAINVAKGTTPTLLLVGAPEYLEYMLIDGKLEEIGDTEVDLTGYATEQFVLDKGYQNADQVNALINAKAYELPIATNTVLGGVLSSAEETANKVTVEATGTMKVTKITTDILTNGSEELILFGGNSGAVQA